VADEQASVPTGWLHVGFARFITEHHRTFSGLDARAYWPGFFAEASQLVELSGVRDASGFLRLAPFFYNAVAIAPLLVIARCVTRSRRLAWLAVFVYLGANWFQQDYFSPQATAFLLYLIILATLLQNIEDATIQPLHGSLPARLGQAWRRLPGLPAGTTRGQSLGREAALLVIAAAIIVSHQLTPVTLVLSLLAFTLTGYTRYRRLWIVVAVLFMAWFSYGATDFWAGHLGTVFGDIGHLGGNLNQGVASRVSGNPTYQAMQNLRLGWAFVYVALASMGWWSLRRRPETLLFGLLVASAGGLVALQSYGGEIVLRVFLYTSPILAPLAARAVGGLLRRRNSVTAVALTGVLAGYGLLGTVTRGVNIAFERVTNDDVAAAQVLWSHVKKGDKLGYLFPAGAYDAGRIGDLSSVSLQQDDCGAPPLQCAAALAPRFILLSRAQDAAEYLVAGTPSRTTATALGPALVGRGLYKVIYQHGDTELLMLTSPGR
jgi:hypothetical protein